MQKKAIRFLNYLVLQVNHNLKTTTYEILTVYNHRMYRNCVHIQRLHKQFNPGRHARTGSGIGSSGDIVNI